MMAITTLGHDALRFLYGTSSRATSTAYNGKILTPGQPMYLTDRNYLYVGDGITEMHNKKPICAPSIEGYVGDWDENGDFALSVDNDPTHEYYIKVIDDELVIKAPTLRFDTNIEGLLATSTDLGFVKLGSDVLLSGQIQTPSSVSNRTYPVQLNSNNQMGVTIPFPNDEKVKVNSSNDNQNRPLLATVNTPTSGTVSEAYYASDIYVNTSTKTITCTNFAGNATSATKSGASTIWIYPESSNQINIGGTGSGANIFIGATKKDNRNQPTDYWFNVSAPTTNPNYNPNVTLHCKASLAEYAQGVDPTKFSFTPSLNSGTLVGKIKINGIEQNIYCNSDTNNRVTQTKSNSDYIEYALLFTESARGDYASKTEGARFASNIWVNPSAGVLSCPTFLGNLTGTASNATTSVNVSGGTVSATTGAFSSTLTVAGITTLQNKLNVVGDVTITGNLNVTGDIRGNRVFNSVWT